MKDASMIRFDKKNLELLEQIQKEAEKDTAGMSDTEKEQHRTISAALMGELLQLNRGFAIMKAKSFLVRSEPLTFDDVLQDCFIGMMKAAYNFDLARGTSFATYAVYSMFAEVQKDVSTSGIVRLPTDVGQKVHRVDYLDQDTDLMPTKDKITRIAKMSRMSERETEWYMNIRYRFLKPNGYRDEAVPTNIPREIRNHPDKTCLEDEAIKKHDMENAWNLVRTSNRLTERERSVLYHRFGFIDGEPHTLEETAKEMDVTRERIRQIESKALRKLRMEVYQYRNYFVYDDIYS